MDKTTESPWSICSGACCVFSPFTSIDRLYVSCTSSRMMFIFHPVTSLFFYATGFYRPVSGFDTICQAVLAESAVIASCTDFEPMEGVELFKPLLSLQWSNLSCCF